jgi:hypothetical protein
LQGDGTCCYLSAQSSGQADELEDELQNVNMVDDEAINAAKERKRKALEAYTGYDDEEFEEGRIGVKADVLGKYDDSFTTGKVKAEVSVFSSPHFALVWFGLVWCTGHRLTRRASDLAHRLRIR